MAKQWHDTKIERRPYLRYNPSMKNQVPKIYRPWFFLVALLLILFGIAIIVLTCIMKSYDEDLHDELFHLWVGIPLLFVGILAIIPPVMKNKKTVILFMIFIIIVMVIAATGAIIAGLRYWMDDWHQTKIDIDDDRCQLGSNNICLCRNVANMPTSLDDCDDLEHMLNIYISVIALDAAAFMICVAGVYLAFMAVCCGPWMYMEWYDEQYDPDFRSKNSEPVRQVGERNRAYDVDPAYGH